MLNTNATTIECFQNKSQKQVREIDFLSVDKMKRIRDFHTTLNGYGVTPLAKLEKLADKYHVKDIYVKDESYRFGLNAFKALGGVYAVTKVLCERMDISIDELQSITDLKSKDVTGNLKNTCIVTATDGNHGRGVAWAASMLGCKSVVFMPKGSAKIRAQNIDKINGAEAIITELNYDQAVIRANDYAEKNDGILIQDTAWEGYTEVPTYIVQGYTTLAQEALDQIEAIDGSMPTHVFLQAGVGAMAGGIAGYIVNHFLNKKQPIISVVEPNSVACIYQSAEINDSQPHSIGGNPETIMAGLNCGSPCSITWPILRDYVSYYFKCNDSVSAHGMRLFANPINEDKKIVSGESGAVTMGLVSAILKDNHYIDIREKLKITEDSVILLINTEGDTDPDNYTDIVVNNKYPFEG